MTNCCVVNCSNNPQRNKNLSFHHFPNKKKHSAIHRAWLVKLKREKFVPTKHSVVCSDHFTENDYDQSSILKKKLMPSCKHKLKLKEDAIPSLKLTGKETDVYSSKQRASSYLAIKKLKTEVVPSIQSSVSMKMILISAVTLI